MKIASIIAVVIAVGVACAFYLIRPSQSVCEDFLQKNLFSCDMAKGFSK